MSDLSPSPAAPPGWDPPPAGAALGYQGYGMVDRDTEHLRILSICWYVVSGLSALFGLFPLIYVALGLAMVFLPDNLGAGPGAHGAAGPPPTAIGWIFVAIGLAFSAFIWTAAALGFCTAFSLTRHRRLWVCYVAAAVACIQVPIGTILGIFTFLVLSRPTVRSRFEPAAPQP